MVTKKELVRAKTKLSEYQIALKNATNKKQRHSFWTMTIHYKNILGIKLNPQEQAWYSKFIKTF